MKYDPDRHHRRSLRLKDYDYAQEGAYFVTLCAVYRDCLFGEALENKVVLNDLGAAVCAMWDALPQHYSYVELDAFVVMPNHVHAILLFDGKIVGNTVGAGLKPAPTSPTKRHALTEIVRAFKTFSARRINHLRGTPSVPVWQRGFYDRIIRSPEELDRIRQYIADNPAAWKADEENPDIARPV